MRFSVFGLFCGILGRRIFCGLLCGRLNGLSLILAKQQTLVLVQLFLTAVQIDSHGGQRTGHSGQRGDNSDQT